MGKKYKKTEELVCRVCNESFSCGKKLSNHLIKAHDLKSVEYTIKYIYNGLQPRCPVCNSETRYVSYGFKKYCKDHSNHAESEAGSVGGKIKRQWNKGLSKETNEIVARVSSNLTGEKNPFWGKKHSESTLKRIASTKRNTYEEILSRFEKYAPRVKLLSQYEEYEDQNSQLRIKCSDCETESEVTLFNLSRCWMCRTCNPIGSRQQIEIYNWIRSLGFNAESSTRKVIPPLELDIWIPEKNIAIEYHGLYWHSGGKQDVFDKGIHRNKMLRCRSEGIRLIQIFSDEWREKREIIESIILHALGMSGQKLNGRDCEIRQIDHSISSSFLEDSHISGSTRAKIHLGLYHKEHGLVGVCTGRVPIQKKWGKVFEVARLAFKRGFSVRGGASKLMNHLYEWSIQNGYDGLFSYSDLRLGEGGVYSSSGFEKLGESPHNYWYTDGHTRYDRFKYRAHDGVSEIDVAKREGVRPCWGAGNAIWKRQMSRTS